MDTDTNTIMRTGLSGPIPFPAVQSTQQAMRDKRTASADTGYIAQIDDPRWVFAMRVRSRIESARNKEYESMIDEGRQHGLSPMQSGLIIGIVERAHDRGGIDAVAYDEIREVPDSFHDGITALSMKSRWIVFSALFLWAFAIAGLMQIAA